MGKKLNEIDLLNKEIQKLTPKHGKNPFSEDKEKEKGEEISLTKFEELPISKKTKEGLKKSGFITMTDIQKSTIIHALAGRDVLGASKTGSGKTLAFCVPLIENLYRQKWSKFDGLGALIITPSRELALQIFELLRTFGKYHSFSIGLVVGGNSKFEEEKKFINSMNVLVATPGRLLQHLDQTYGFSCDNLQLLVLDEADRLLESGFENEINAILQNLPKRQTLLFSATQTSKLKDLIRLSLDKKNTEYISILDKEVMPTQLTQAFIECPLYDKIDILFSFIKSHVKKKIIVFCTSQKQVSFLHSIFYQLNLGTSILKLSANMSQNKRRENYEDYLSKKFSVIFCTDVASRGLDFPKVDFVIHMDLPLNEKVYIHRSGRTARNNQFGKSILMILPEEREFIDKLKEKKIEIKEMKVNINRTVSIQNQLAAMISHDVKLKYLAMKYLESYVKSINKKCTAIHLNINDLPLKEFSERLGLADVPNLIESLKDSEKKEEKVNTKEIDESDLSDDEIDLELKQNGGEVKKKAKKNKMERLITKKEPVIYSKSYQNLVKDTKEEDDQDLFEVKRLNHDLEAGEDEITPIYSKKVRVNHNLNTHIIFKDDGKQMTKFEALIEKKKSNEDLDEKKKEYTSKLSERLDENDEKDKELFKEVIRERRKKKKEKEQELYDLKKQVSMLEDGIIPHNERESEPIVTLASDEEIIDEAVEEPSTGGQDVFEALLASSSKRKRYDEDDRIQKRKDKKKEKKEKKKEEKKREIEEEPSIMEKKQKKNKKKKVEINDEDIALHLLNERLK